MEIDEDAEAALLADAILMADPEIAAWVAEQERDDVTFGKWNHRVIRTQNDTGDFIYGVYEVYYDADWRPVEYSRVARGIVGATPADVAETVNRMQRAMLLPVFGVEGTSLIELPDHPALNEAF